MIRRTQKGFTLIEVLVSLLVLSIGLVGMAALYMNSIRNIHSSYYHSLASTIALDLEERIWAAVTTELTTPGQWCLTNAQLTAIGADLQTRWRITPPSNRAGIPGLTVTLGNINTVVRPPRNRLLKPGMGTWTERWVEIPVTLRWAEARFVGQEEERFDYITRAPCMSQFTPAS